MKTLVRADANRPGAHPDFFYVPSVFLLTYSNERGVLAEPIIELHFGASGKISMTIPGKRKECGDSDALEYPDGRVLSFKFGWFSSRESYVRLMRKWEKQPKDDDLPKAQNSVDGGNGHRHALH